MTENSATNSKEHLLIRAALGQKVERPPVWAMRQAGRWDPEFRKIRSGLSFYEFSEDVERAAEASLLPRRFGVDGIILFYDITTLAIAMGLPFTLQPQQGPIPDKPIRASADVARLEELPDPDRFAHIRALLREVKKELNGELPVIVFAGAPFTVAAYCIGAGKKVEQTRRFASEKTQAWYDLLQKISIATVHFLNTLAGDGADIYQLFDSWAGLLTHQEYHDWAQPYHREIFARADKTPRILFVKECPYLEMMAQAGAEVVSLGQCHDLSAARRDFPDLVFQGNVDQELMKCGTPDQVRSATLACVQAGGGTRHIVNLNHGMDKDAPMENFAAYVGAVRGA